jgi:hypothetical protein
MDTLFLGVSHVVPCCFCGFLAEYNWSIRSKRIRKAIHKIFQRRPGKRYCDFERERVAYCNLT